MRVQVIFVLEHSGAVLTSVIGRLRMDQDHVPSHIGSVIGRFSAQSALVDAPITNNFANQELHDIST